MALDEMKDLYVKELLDGFLHKSCHSPYTHAVDCALRKTKCSYRMLVAITVYTWIASVVHYGRFAKDIERVYANHLWHELFSSLGVYVDTGDDTRFQELLTELYRIIIIEDMTRSVESKFTGGLTNSYIEDLERIMPYGSMNETPWTVLTALTFSEFMMDKQHVFFTFLDTMEKDEGLLNSMFCGLAELMVGKPYNQVVSSLKFMRLI